MAEFYENKVQRYTILITSVYQMHFLIYELYIVAFVGLKRSGLPASDDLGYIY